MTQVLYFPSNLCWNGWHIKSSEGKLYFTCNCCLQKICSKTLWIIHKVCNTKHETKDVVRMQSRCFVSCFCVIYFMNDPLSDSELPTFSHLSLQNSNALPKKPILENGKIPQCITVHYGVHMDTYHLDVLSKHGDRRLVKFDWFRGQRRGKIESYNLLAISPILTLHPRVVI